MTNPLEVWSLNDYRYSNDQTPQELFKRGTIVKQKLPLIMTWVHQKSTSSTIPMTIKMGPALLNINSDNFTTKLTTQTNNVYKAY